MLWDHFNNDIFIDVSCFDTLSEAVAEGRRRCVDEDDNFQIWKRTAGQSKMDIVLEEEYKK
jgi:hypothetical protein